MARVKPGQPLAEAENEETIAMAVKEVQRFRSQAQAVQYFLQALRKSALLVPQGKAMA